MDREIGNLGNLPDVERMEDEISGRIDVIIADLLQHRRRIDSALARLRKAQKALTGLRPDRETTGASGNPVPYKPRADSRAAIITRAATEALQNAGRPLNRQQIIDSMKEASINVDAANLAQLISKVLWKSDLFTNHRGVGYWFSDQPLPKR